MTPTIPLFKDNPYKYIKDDSNDKFLYILIKNTDPYEDYEIMIKKPKIYNDIKLNKINILPKLVNDDKKYYHQIKVPKRNNSLLFQTLKDDSFKFSFQKNGFQYRIINKYGSFYLPINILDANEYMYIDYFEKDYSKSFINIIEENEFTQFDRNQDIELNPNVEQISGTNKIKIKMDSLSYIFPPNIVKYYVLINIDFDLDRFGDKTYSTLLSIITGKIKTYEAFNEFMTIIEDDGKKEIYETEIEIDIELKNKNKIIFLPINKNNDKLYLLYQASTNFDYNNKTNYLKIFLIIGIIIILIIAIALIIYFKKKRNNTGSDDVNNVLLGEMNINEKNQI